MDYDKLELEKKVYRLIESSKCEDLRSEIMKLSKKSSVWQAYVETVDSIGEIWRSFGRQSRGISDSDYSLAHAILFKNLPVHTKRILIVKMENLMNARSFMKSEEALTFFRKLV